MTVKEGNKRRKEEVSVVLSRQRRDIKTRIKEQRKGSNKTREGREKRREIKRSEDRRVQRRLEGGENKLDNTIFHASLKFYNVGSTKQRK